MHVLPALDPVLFKVGRSTRGGLWIATAMDWRPPLLGFRLIAGVLWLGDTKQAFCGDAALRACALHLVDATKNSLVRYIVSHSICSDLSARKRVDNLGTEISRTRDWSGLGPNLSRTSDYRWQSHLVLSRQTAVAQSFNLYLSTVGR